MPAQRAPIFLPRLKTVRLRQDLSLDELAAKAGVSKTQLSDIERQAKGTTKKTLALICAALDTTERTLTRKS